MLCRVCRGSYLQRGGVSKSNAIGLGGEANGNFIRELNMKQHKGNEEDQDRTDVMQENGWVGGQIFHRVAK